MISSHKLPLMVLTMLAAVSGCSSEDRGETSGSTEQGATSANTGTSTDSAGSSAGGSGGGSSTGGAGATGTAGSGGDGGSIGSGGSGGGGGGANTAAVDLGTAGDYVILAKSAISTVPTSAVTGNLGLSPAASSFVTGFSLTADATNVFSTSPQVTGKVYAANYAVPTPSNLTTAVGDMELAFTDAAGRAPDFTEVGAGDVGGMTLAAGVYKWGTGLLIPTNVTLDGSADHVWIFQVAGDLVVSSAVKVVLIGGALPKNVFWQVAGLVDIGTTAHFEGVVLVQTAATLHTGASLNGRLLAQTAVSIDGNAIVQPAP